jgi:hypothetical protein
MPKRDVKPFLLRIDPQVLAAVQVLADAELRSLNGQIEFLLREAVRKRGVKVPPDRPTGTEVAPADRG